MKPYNKTLFLSLAAAAATILLGACKDKESYADLLRDEEYAMNAYLADFPVRTEVPADGHFITAEEIQAAEGLESLDEAIKRTPFYRMDSDGNVYMQVISNPADGVRAAEDQEISFRFTRYNLTIWYRSGIWEGDGNADGGGAVTTFRFDNTTLPSTTQWGTGIQTPLHYLNLGCRVNLVMKSYVGPYQEVASVFAFCYNVMYLPLKI